MTSITRRTLIGTAAATLAVSVLAGCVGNKPNQPFKDAPRNGADNSPALVIEMPDGFSNLATKCVGGVRYTVAYHGDSKYGAVATVVDPSCRNGG
jgi:hypothetical protein